MTKSAAHLSWDELDDAGLRAGIAAIERRERHVEEARAADAQAPSNRLPRTTGTDAIRPGTDAPRSAGKLRRPVTKRKISGRKPDTSPSMDRSGKA